MLFAKMSNSSTNHCILKELDWLEDCLQNKALHTHILWTERTCSLYKICFTATPSIYVEYAIHSYQ